MKIVTTTLYHLQVDGQCERFNRTLLDVLRGFASEHPKSWPEYAELLAFSYNSQVHAGTGHTPFELVLSNPPSSLTLIPERSLEYPKEPRQLFKQFEQAIRLLTKSASRNIDRAQERYKQKYYKRVRPVDPPAVGDCM